MGEEGGRRGRMHEVYRVVSRQRGEKSWVRVVEVEWVSGVRAGCGCIGEGQPRWVYG